MIEFYEIRQTDVSLRSFCSMLIADASIMPPPRHTPNSTIAPGILRRLTSSIEARIFRSRTRPIMEYPVGGQSVPQLRASASKDIVLLHPSEDDLSHEPEIGRPKTISVIALTKSDGFSRSRQFGSPGVK